MGKNFILTNLEEKPLNNHFIVVGPGRSGSTWIYELLLNHPKVRLAKNIKETQFFNENYSKGISWYINFFEEAKDNYVTGEVSNLYFDSKNVSQRIKKIIPNCKIIILLRNPIDRFISIQNFKVREGRISKNEIDSSFNKNEILKILRIDKRIKEYSNLFDDILFIDFDDIKNYPEKIQSQLFDFLCLNHYEIQFGKGKNESIIPRHQKIGRIAKSLAILLRKFGLYSLLTFLKRNYFVKRVFFIRKKLDIKFSETEKILIKKTLKKVILNTNKYSNIDFKKWLNHKSILN